MVTTRSQKRALDATTSSDDDAQDKRFKLDIDDIFSVDNESYSPDDEESSRWLGDIIDANTIDQPKLVEVNYHGLVKILSKSHPDASKNLQETLDFMQAREPDFLGILKEDLEPEQRARLIELFEALKEYQHASEQGQPCRMESINIRDQICRLKKQFGNKQRLKKRLACEIHSGHEKAKTQLEQEFIDNRDSLEFKILGLETSHANRSVIYDKYKRHSELPHHDDERAKLQNWLDWAVKIPHDKILIPQTEISHAEKLSKLARALDDRLYGMKTVKEQILTFFNMRLQRKGKMGDILALVGSPGTGKTSIARYLTEVSELPFAQINFGGLRDASFLKGFDYTYIGSAPGEFVRSLSRMKYKNGIIFMDEFEKAATNPDIVATLLHIIDKQQNSDFRDNYLSQLRIDLSHVWFMCSMNSLPKDQALRDRLHIINVPGYNIKDKVEILLKYTLPKSLKSAGLNDGDIVISEEVAHEFVNRVSPGISGVREIERNCNDLIRKLCFLANKEDNFPVKLSFDLCTSVKYPYRLRSSDLKILEKTDSQSTPMFMYT